MADDVYSFTIIAFEIITNEKPFIDLINKVVNGSRPTTNFQIHVAYKELIESCWYQDQNERPTLENLKNNEGFITNLFDEVEFLNYVDYINDCKVSFDSGNPFISINNFVKRKRMNEKKQKENDSDLIVPNLRLHREELKKIIQL